METKIIDGKQIAREIRAELKERIAAHVANGRPVPKMTVILVGEDPASQVYVANKEKACGWIKMASETLRMPASTTTEEVISVIEKLNQDPGIHGILVQLPLPDHINKEAVLKTIDPKKDVDGFHVVNAGQLFTGTGDPLVACTPSGVIQMLKRSGIEITGKHCVIAGRSNIVGKPMAMLMMNENATVTVIHTRTQNERAFIQDADIFIAAVGRPNRFSGDDIKEGAVVIDVGIHRTENGLCGDCDYASMLGKASYITPVPGGVGPMTIAMLLSNCLKAYEQQIL